MPTAFFTGVMEKAFPIADRSEIFTEITHAPTTQVLIVGGGIHGAACARALACNGVTCTLAEKGDYVGGTSSRSSKMLHGGIRYLENFDIAQVFEGIQAREDQFLTAPHLCRRETFALPIGERDWWQRTKLGIGLRLYKLMSRGRAHHRFANREDPALGDLVTAGASFNGAFLYDDGLTDDARLVLENILDARRHGARCLNYLEVIEIHRKGHRFLVRCQDKIGKGEIEIEAEVVINCAGPWAPYIGYPECEILREKIKYSVGIHLLFDRAWVGPSLCLPIPGERSRYYFVWPHPGGTMVGTTEREVEQAEFDPIPETGEIEEILARLARDLPQSGLDQESLYYGFSGVRTLPLRGRATSTARLSRRHQWRWTGGVLTLIGGKLTTATFTAAEALKQVSGALQLSGNLQSLTGVPFPGCGPPEGLAALITGLMDAGLSEQAAARVVHRYGFRALYLLTSAHGLEPVTPHLTVGEVELAVQWEQAQTLEDVLRRRTGLEYLPGAILPALEPVARQLPARADDPGRKAEIETYRERLQAIQMRLGKPG